MEHTDMDEVADDRTLVAAQLVRLVVTRHLEGTTSRSLAPLPATCRSSSYRVRIPSLSWADASR
jgi:hypothetical protein